MLDILTRSGCFVAIILLGYALKKVGVFKQEDFPILSKVVIRITLPAAIITSFAGKELDLAMLSIVLLGLGGGMIYMLAGFFASPRADRAQRAFEVLNLPGYNIGNFTLPFVQSFLGPMGVITTSLFDVGNAFVCLGGAYGVASMVKDGAKFSIVRILKALCRSVPFLTHVSMLALNLANISLPGPVLDLAQIIADGNAFLAMFMIGVGFNLGGDKSQMGRIIKLLTIRYAIASVLAWALYTFLPFGLEIRQTLVILCFSPVGSAVPAFTEELGEDVGLSSAINSIAIIISIVIIMTLLTVML